MLFIGTSVGGFPEVIINDKLGILAEPRDANGLAEEILRALDNKWDADYIGNYAGQFTWDRIAEMPLDVYGCKIVSVNCVIVEINL